MALGKSKRCLLKSSQPHIFACIQFSIRKKLKKHFMSCNLKIRFSQSNV